MDTNRTPLTWRQVLLDVFVLHALFTVADQEGALQKAERLSTKIARTARNGEIADLATQVKGAFRLEAKCALCRPSEAADVASQIGKPT